MAANESMPRLDVRRIERYERDWFAFDGVHIDHRHLEPLYDWFVERVEKREETKQFALESKAGAEGKEDAQAFFVSDVYQLQQVKGLFIYCAPIYLAYEVEAVQNFDMVFHLPMIKVENEDGSPNEDGLQAMQRMLLLRADASLFDGEVAEQLARACGGNPRDLLRLLGNAFSYAEGESFDVNSATRAVRDMASDYRRILRPVDYRVLARIDAGQEVDSDRLNPLLYNLALLEYNNFYLRSHPVVRTTEEYRRAADTQWLNSHSGSTKTTRTISEHPALST